MPLEIEYCFSVWEEHIKNTPSYPVLSDSLGTTLKRQECEDISARIYGWLKENHVGREDFVLINLNRGVKPVLAVMGVLKNGSAFSLVESGYAKERIDYIRENCHAVIEINEANWAEILKTQPLPGYEIPDDHDACMTVYTSGTTGTPKGVIHEYGQIKMEMISERRSDGSWRENVNTRWGLVAPLNFVASLKIIVHFLYCGGHLYVLDYDTVKNSKKLNAYFLTHRINETFLSPSLLRIKGDNFGPFMKYIYTGAEPANNIFIKGLELNNTYTMSESFFTVCEYIIDRSYPIVPIGNPMFDLQIKLIDENGSEVAEGERGEFCFYNPYCRGYVNNEEENRKHFENGWFHTGDLAVYENGRYVLKGRIDDMIKIDGNRIEPSEIEAVCKEEMGLSTCAAKGYEEGFVALYYVDDVKFNEDELRDRLKKRLPYYMIPTYFVKIEKMPLNQSGKLDRKALKIPKQVYKAEYVAPRDDFEKLLCEGFSKVLEIDEVGIKDDFFKLGGSSIKAIQLLSEVDADEELTPSMLYEGRTVENISELYKKAKAITLSPEEKENLGREKPCPISEIQSLFWNDFYDCSLDFFFGLKILPIVSANKVAEKINRYIDANSTFNMVIRKDANGNPVQVYVPEKPYVKVEHMSLKEAKAVCKTFVQRFTYNEPLIRIRVLQTPLCSFFLFHVSHVVMDGASCHNAIMDMTAAIKGKEIPVTNYFAFAYEETLRNQKKNFQQNLDRFKDRYFTKPRLANLRKSENTTDDVRKHTKPFGIPLKTVQDFCEAHGISVNVFINTAVLLTLCAYNESTDGMVFWNYQNRSDGGNRGGVMYRSAINDMDMTQVKTLNDAFESINQQNVENLWRYSDHDYYRAFSHLIKGPKMTISYMEGWFTDDLPKSLALFCQRYRIRNSVKSTSKTSSNTLLTFSHYRGKLYCGLQYCTGFVRSDDANHFVKMLKTAMKDMMEDRLPLFSK